MRFHSQRSCMFLRMYFIWNSTSSFLVRKNILNLYFKPYPHTFFYLLLLFLPLRSASAQSFAQPPAESRIVQREANGRFGRAKPIKAAAELEETTPSLGLCVGQGLVVRLSPLQEAAPTAVLRGARQGSILGSPRTLPRWLRTSFPLL